MDEKDKRYVLIAGFVLFIALGGLSKFWYDPLGALAYLGIDIIIAFVLYWIYKGLSGVFKEDKKSQKNKPKSVHEAVILLYMTLMLSVLHLILYFSGVIQIASLEKMSAGYILIINMFSLGLMAFFIYMIDKGRNWARNLYLVLFVIGLPMSIPALIEVWSTSIISATISIIGLALQIYALYILFQKPVSDWFKPKK